MTREEEENETVGVAGYAMVVMKEYACHEHHFFALFFGREHGGALAFVQIRSYKPCPVRKSTVCTSRFARKLVLLEHCLGNGALTAHGLEKRGRCNGVLIANFLARSVCPMPVG